MRYVIILSEEDLELLQENPGDKNCTAFKPYAYIVLDDPYVVSPGMKLGIVLDIYRTFIKATIHMAGKQIFPSAYPIFSRN